MYIKQLRYVHQTAKVCTKVMLYSYVTMELYNIWETQALGLQSTRESPHSISCPTINELHSSVKLTWIDQTSEEQPINEIKLCHYNLPLPSSH